MLGNLELALTQAFISYAHDDYLAFEEFHAGLKAVARAFKLDVWADKRLRPAITGMTKSRKRSRLPIFTFF